MAIIERRPGLRAPGLVGQAGGASTTSNPAAGLAAGLARLGETLMRRQREARDRADQATLAQLSADFQIAQGAALDAGAQAYDGSAPGFAEAENERYSAALETFVETAPEHLRGRLSERLGTGPRVQHVLAAQRVELARTQERALRGAVETADAAANAVQADPAALGTALEAVGRAAQALPPALQADFMEEQRERVAAGYASARATASPDMLLAELDSGELDGLIDPADHEQYRRAARAEIARREAEAERAREEAERRAKAAREEAQRNRYALLGVEVDAGRAGVEAVEAAFAAGQIDPMQFRLLRADAIRAGEDAAEAAERAALLTPGAPLDPTNPDVRAAVDDQFRAAGALDALRAPPDAEGVDPAQGVQAAVVMARTYNTVPESAASVLSVQAEAGSAEQRARALDAVAQLSGAAPTSAGREFSGDLLDDARLYARRAAAGLAPADALAAVDAARAARRDGGVEALRKAAEKTAAEMDLGALLRQFDRTPLIRGGRPGFAGGRVAQAQALDTYRQLYIDAFASGIGDADARALAADRLGRIYGVTRVTGARAIMPYPPEAYYSVQGADDGWMAEQLLAETRAALERPDLAPEDVRLVADAQTAAEAQAGMAPSYSVLTMRADGVFETLPGRFVFDPSAPAMEAAAAAQEDAEAVVQRARRVQTYYDDTPPQLRVMP